MAAMEYVTPIDEECRNRVREHTRHFIRLAETLFDCRLPDLPVRFDLRGKSSGMYRLRGKAAEIRYNPWFFAAHYGDCMANTVPHEVAHYVVDRLFGMKNVRPHGREWQRVMTAFGVEPRATSALPLDGIPTRNHRTFSYRCACDTHRLGIRRHRRIRRGHAWYSCRRCGERLEPDG